jgi:hypothetical protein
MVHLLPLGGGGGADQSNNNNNNTTANSMNNNSATAHKTIPVCKSPIFFYFLIFFFHLHLIEMTVFMSAIDQHTFLFTCRFPTDE